jgi:hypothetical protein
MAHCSTCLVVVGCIAMVLAPVMRVVSSRSLLVMSPVGFDVETSRCCMGVENGARHTTGWCGDSVKIVGSQKPPMPIFDASVAPTVVGAIGTREESETGVLARLCAIATQSAKDCRTSLEIHNRCPF